MQPNRVKSRGYLAIKIVVGRFEEYHFDPIAIARRRILHTEQQLWQTPARLVQLQLVVCWYSIRICGLAPPTTPYHCGLLIAHINTLIFILKEEKKMLNGIRLIASAAARSVRAGACAPRPAGNPAAAAGQRNLVGLLIRYLVCVPIVCIL